MAAAVSVVDTVVVGETVTNPAASPGVRQRETEKRNDLRPEEKLPRQDCLEERPGSRASLHTTPANPPGTTPAGSWPVCFEAKGWWSR